MKLQFYISAVRRIMMSLKKGLSDTLHIPGVRLWAQVILVITSRTTFLQEVHTIKKF